MNLYYVVNARMRSGKAYAIQIGHMQKAFSAHAKVHLLTPSGFGVPDWYARGRVGFFVSSLLFMLITASHLLFKRLSGERFVVYMPDMDTFSGTLLPYIAPTFAEMHSPKKPTLFMKLFFSRVRGVVATTAQTKESLVKNFGIPEQKFLVEPNGVDEKLFTGAVSKAEARKKLGLPDEPFALYVGRFYAWKGLGVLADAAADSPLPIQLVGGTNEEFELVSGKSGKGLRFAGVRPAEEVPLWLAAADVLLVLGTAKNEDSYRYTSPMKIFEYLAAGRPVVASRTPAVSGILDERSAFWYEPDDAGSLARAIGEAVASENATAKIEAGRALAAKHTWSKRAEHILAFMDATGSLDS